MFTAGFCEKNNNQLYFWQQSCFLGTMHVKGVSADVNLNFSIMYYDFVEGKIYNIF